MRSTSRKSTIKNANYAIGGPKLREADPSALADQAASARLLNHVAKRVFDLAVATLGLILFSPIFLLVSVAIKLGSRGSVLVREVRYDYDGELILVFKFRSSGNTENGRSGSPVTRVGRILRSSGIDGLPQLVNVLRGGMSIVGPRPFMAVPDNRFEEQISRISQQNRVKPGITGWAQANGHFGDSRSFGAMQRRIEYDLYYIEKWSFFFDMKIIVMTLLSKGPYLQ
jgi:lipopolysaccharide/colanic/teichoic acid biosynthesis glycosyltransferase